MIDVAEERKNTRRRGDTELGARKERLRKVTSTPQDIGVEKKSFGKGARDKTSDADMENGTPVLFK